MSIAIIKKRNFEDYFKEMPSGKIIRLVDNSKFINEWTNVDTAYMRKNNKGIYMIGDFYIGKSINIRQRFVSHYKLCLRHEHVNNEFQNRFNQLLREGETIEFKVLDSNPNEALEQSYIDKYKAIGYPLVNCDKIIYPDNYCSITKLLNKYKNKYCDNVPMKILVADLEKIRREFNQKILNN